MENERRCRVYNKAGHEHDSVSVRLHSNSALFRQMNRRLDDNAVFQKKTDDSIVKADSVMH